MPRKNIHVHIHDGTALQEIGYNTYSAAIYACMQRLKAAESDAQRTYLASLLKRLKMEQAEKQNSRITDAKT